LTTSHQALKYSDLRRRVSEERKEGEEVREWRKRSERRGRVENELSP
jgi:hypothetical protein